MFMVSPQKWILIYMVTLIIATVVLSKIYTSQTVITPSTHQPLPSLLWKW